MAEEKAKKPKAEKKPWEEDVFGVGKSKPKPDTSAMKQRKPAGVTEEASETHDALKKRNKALADRYGETKKGKKRDPKRSDSKRR